MCIMEGNLNLLEILTREMELRNYSHKTIEAYTRVIKDIYVYYKRPPRDLNDFVDMKFSHLTFRD